MKFKLRAADAMDFNAIPMLTPSGKGKMGVDGENIIL